MNAGWHEAVEQLRSLEQIFLALFLLLPVVVLLWMKCRRMFNATASLTYGKVLLGAWLASLLAMFAHPYGENGPPPQDMIIIAWAMVGALGAVHLSLLVTLLPRKREY